MDNSHKLFLFRNIFSFAVVGIAFVLLSNLFNDKNSTLLPFNYLFTGEAASLPLEVVEAKTESLSESSAPQFDNYALKTIYELKQDLNPNQIISPIYNFIALTQQKIADNNINEQDIKSINITINNHEKEIALFVYAIQNEIQSVEAKLLTLSEIKTNETNTISSIKKQLQSNLNDYKESLSELQLLNASLIELEAVISSLETQFFNNYLWFQYPFLLTTNNLITINKEVQLFLNRLIEGYYFTTLPYFEVHHLLIKMAGIVAFVVGLLLLFVFPALYRQRLEKINTDKIAQLFLLFIALGEACITAIGTVAILASVSIFLYPYLGANMINFFSSTVGSLMILNFFFSFAYFVLAKTTLLKIDSKTKLQLHFMWRLSVILLVVNRIIVTPYVITHNYNSILLIKFIITLALLFLIMSISFTHYYQKISPKKIATHIISKHKKAVILKIQNRRIFQIVTRLALKLSFMASVVVILMGYINIVHFLTIRFVLFLSLGFANWFLLLCFKELFTLSYLKFKSNVINPLADFDHQKLTSVQNFWVNFSSATILLVANLPILALLFGFEAYQVRFFLENILSDLTIGGTTISISSFVKSIIIFSIMLSVGKIIKRLLVKQILPIVIQDSAIINSTGITLGYANYFLASLLAIRTLGINFSELKLIASALSVGIGFGLQSIFNNFISGLILLIERPIKVGDWVVIPGKIEGYVKNIRFRSTEIETFDKAIVIVPNTTLITEPVSNLFSNQRVGRTIINFVVDHHANVDTVYNVAIEVIKKHPSVLKYPAPFVLFLNIDAIGKHFSVRVFVPDVDMHLFIASDIRFMLSKALEEKNIQLASLDKQFVQGQTTSLPTPHSSR